MGIPIQVSLCMNYCSAVRDLPENALHRRYHDHEYGFPVTNDYELFGRLILEINQAGLSWTTILKKQEHFRAAYAEFDIARIAAFSHDDVSRLMSDPGIVRNRLKIEAAIFNAQQVLKLQLLYGSFFNWLCEELPCDRFSQTMRFRKIFRFTGGEIVNEFLMSTGLLPGAHTPDCPVFEKTRTAGALHFNAF